MPDPQILYIVTAVVVLGLVAWVIVVLSRPDGKNEAAVAPSTSPVASRSAKVDLPKAKPWLHAHAEITDEPAKPAARARDASRGGEAGANPGLELAEDDEPTGPNALILVTAVARTDPGLKRKNNEDAYAILEDHHLFVIADGMGRHAAGEVASRLCIEAITEAFRSGKFDAAGESPPPPGLPRRAARLRGATLQANERIRVAASENDAYAGMGTTVVSAYFSPSHQRVYIAHVGDSRCYRLRGGSLTQLTTDHTLGAAGIQGKTAAVLSRALGVEASVEVELTIELPLPDDIYLLCSDGLSRMVPAAEIESTLRAAPSLDEATKTLTDLANREGGRDNITVILVRVDPAKVIVS